MTHKFKPGDIVRAKATVRIDAITDTGLLKFEHHNMFYGEPHLYELVEPSVTHRELREVLEELKRQRADSTHKSIWNAALEAFFFQLTGERP